MVGTKTPAFGELNLIRIVLGILGRKIFDPKRFTVLLDLGNQFRRKIMMVNVDGGSGSAGTAGWC